MTRMSIYMWKKCWCSNEGGMPPRSWCVRDIHGEPLEYACCWLGLIYISSSRGVAAWYSCFNKIYITFSTGRYSLWWCCILLTYPHWGISLLFRCTQHGYLHFLSCLTLCVCSVHNPQLLTTNYIYLCRPIANRKSQYTCHDVLKNTKFGNLLRVNIFFVFFCDR